MISITEKKNCCGCTACSSICPKKAIEMVEDEEGFLYPQVDKEKCVNCGLCDKVCPVLNKKQSEIEPKAYAMRTKDMDVLRRSTSGGFFTPLAKYVLDKNGVVFGVGYDEQLKVIHKETRNIDGVAEMIGSKYVQSYLGESFSIVKKYLDNDVLVLFSGTPCQVAGLKNFLMKDYENLITMDLICHGTPSPKLWRKYIEYQERKYKSKVREAYFRNKTYGYHSGTMKLVFENGKKYYGSARVDFMLKSFFKEISSRPACYECSFKTKRHCSDFTVFDCWHISQVVPEIKDDDKGYTNVFVNSNKAEEILRNIKETIDIYSVDMDEIIKLDGPMVENCKKPHINRKEFYKNIDTMEICKLVNLYIPISRMDYVIERSKFIFYKIGIINVIRMLKG